MISAAELVGTVRGRRLCYELAARGAAGDSLRTAMFAEARRVHEDRGDIRRGEVAYLRWGDGDDATPPPAPRLVDALAAVDPAAAVAAEHLLPALAETVASAMYWQPPDAQDVVVAEVSDALLPVADAVLRAPEVAWWSAAVDRERQVITRFEPSTHPEPPGTVTGRLHRWRQDTLDQQREAARYRRRHPHASLGGTWWASPVLAGLDHTTRDLGPEGSAALWLTEDELGWGTAHLVGCSVDGPRVLEISGPADWAMLVGTYPLDVTPSRAPDWYGAVAARPGRWLIPDWSAVAADYDGVHVSVVGWLATSGEAVPVDAGATTTLAGWDPDATWWLADVVHPAGPERLWVRDEERWLPGP